MRMLLYDQKTRKRLKEGRDYKKEEDKVIVFNRKSGLQSIRLCGKHDLCDLYKITFA